MRLGPVVQKCPLRRSLVRGVRELLVIIAVFFFFFVSRVEEHAAAALRAGVVVVIRAVHRDHRVFVYFVCIAPVFRVFNRWKW